MRGILFRGKRCDNGEWVIGAFCPKNSDTPFGPMVDKPSIIKLDPPLDGYWFDVDPDTVGKYTGLKDKNGKRIFEGDIVAQSWYDYDAPSDDSFGEVVFCEYDCSFSVMDVQKDGIVPLGRCHAYHWEAEVIGNIHDNPELLEVDNG